VSALIVDLDGTLVDAAVADHPRAWGRSAERAMAVRLVDAWHVLGSAGGSLTGHAPRPRRT
jgi:beta-phosphoglucomutase-like phosphatase (HAD superfamily)